jgi:biopolymer transport protein ExbD
MALRSGSKVKAEFSMSSMTDIIFLLLIFFIVTSTIVREPVLKVILPKSTQKVMKKQVVHVTVDQELNYSVDRKKSSLDRLQSDLEAVLMKNPGATVSVHADKRVEYDKVMELVRLADKMDVKVVLALAQE